MVATWYLLEALPLWSQQRLYSFGTYRCEGIYPGVRDRAQHLGHQDSLSYCIYWSRWMNFVHGILVQCGTDIDVKLLYRSVTYFSWPSDLPYVLKAIWWTNVILSLLVPSDTKIYLIKCMWANDLHFWSSDWVISWRLFDELICIWDIA